MDFHFPLVMDFHFPLVMDFHFPLVMDFCSSLVMDFGFPLLTDSVRLLQYKDPSPRDKCHPTHGHRPAQSCPQQ
jgi:hypothetical protein